MSIGNEFRVFIDIDGVLADWYGGVAKVYDALDLEDPETRQILKEGNDLSALPNTDEDGEIWPLINAGGTEWWSDLELFPWAKNLYDSMSEIAEVAFLTSCGKVVKSATQASAGKVAWVDKHFGDVGNLIITYAKQFCAGPNTLLIDDSAKKINKFKEWGGRTALWPTQFAFEDGDEDPDQLIKDIIRSVEKFKSE